MKAGFFIAGTDTGVGKTRSTCALLHAAAQLGYQTVGMKPVAAGCERRDIPEHEGHPHSPHPPAPLPASGARGASRAAHATFTFNEDVEALIAASSVKAERRLVNPYPLREAIAPHIAAERQGVNLRIAPVRAALDALAEQAEVVLVEGAGGLLVPLDAEHDMADLAVALGLPVILVVGMRLGCINHTLLTAEAIARRGLTLAGWMANDLGTGMAAYSDNLASLQKRLPAPLLAEFPWQPQGQALDAAQFVIQKRFSYLLAKKSGCL